MTLQLPQPEAFPEQPSDPARLRLALRVIAMPKDTNPYGSIFGGVILSYIDQAAFVQARLHAKRRWVTLALDRVEFKQPVYVGDTLNFYTRTVKAGRTSVTVEVDVHAERFAPPSPGTTGKAQPAVSVTAATLVMVAVDDTGRSVPFNQPIEANPDSQW
ncbi:MAG: acyl-CoA thioesterase [Phycisphaerales bacterium]|nr:acyl-CoA thioesterase [Phycisphaerales bacterium]